MVLFTLLSTLCIMVYRYLKVIFPFITNHTEPGNPALGTLCIPIARL